MPTIPWDQVRDVVDAVLDLPPDARASYLDQACAEPVVRRYVESLIQSYEQAGSFLNETVPAWHSQVLTATEAGAWKGRRLGAYQVIEQVGEGGMGEVYRAVRADDQYQKQVAIKLVRGGFDSRFTLARLRSERQILANLDHPNITRLLDGGATEEGQPYLVMEYVEGVPLNEYCDGRALTVTERLELFRTVCDAVQYAHQNLVIHRDLKPGNILVTAEGAPKLLDFGIAKILDNSADPAAARTLTIVRLLTPEYASPEQLRGETITTASDVYSLGVVLYELLTGHRPYGSAGRRPDEIARAVTETEPEKPSTAISRSEETIDSTGELRNLTPQTVSRTREGSVEKLRRRLSGDLDNIVLMALRKEPQRRYASVEQFSEDLRRHLAGLPVYARTDTFAYRSGKFIRRHTTGVMAAALVTVSLIGGLAVALREAHIARLERARAERRFNDLRKLANTFMFDFNDAIQNLSGATHAREMLVKTALQYLDSLAQESRGDASLRDELGSAYVKVGDIQGVLGGQSTGNVSGALESYRKALAIRKSLAEAEPANSLAQRRLAYTYGRIGGMLGQQNDFAGALENDQHAVEILDPLVARNASDISLGMEQALNYQHLAYHLNMKGDFPAAVANHTKAISLFEKLAASKPDDQRIRLELAHSYRLDSLSLRQIGDLAGAREALGKSLPITEQVARASPNNVRAKLDLMSGHEEFGLVLEGGGDLKQALDNWQKALLIGEAVSSIDPNDARAKITLADAYAKVSILQIVLGKSSDESGLLKSLEIRRQLLAANPNNGGRKEAVANAYDTLGQAEASLASRAQLNSNLRADHWRNARSQYKQALSIFLELQAKGALRGEDAQEPEKVRQGIAKCDAALAASR
jgi:non-specific serine/threonine protein kinase/serine/threonine-protein kinase